MGDGESRMSQPNMTDVGCPECGREDADYQRLEAENERLRAELDKAVDASIEARNPGIDMDEVRRLRTQQSGDTNGGDDG